MTFYALNIVFALKCEHFRSLNVLELRHSVNEEGSGASRQWAKCKANELSIQSHREGKRHFGADFDRTQNMFNGYFNQDLICYWNFCIQTLHKFDRTIQIFVLYLLIPNCLIFTFIYINLGL